jgi:hypothetical protein
MMNMIDWDSRTQVMIDWDSRFQVMIDEEFAAEIIRTLREYVRSDDTSLKFEATADS